MTDREAYFIVNKLPNKQRTAVAKARAAGVDWLTILGWLAKYGPDIGKMIKELIDQWREKQ